MKNYASLSIETHLFFARIMKEHALFLQAGFPCKDQDWIQEADRFRRQFEDLLAEVIRIADGNVNGRVLSSDELATRFTLPAERKTQRLSGIPINTRLTVMEQNLRPDTDMRENHALNRTISSINQRALRLLDGLITFKGNILQAVENGALFTANYPLLIKHIIREAELYCDTIASLERDDRGASADRSERDRRNSLADMSETIKRGKRNIPANMYGSENFWNRIMMEHALFIRGLLDPSEDTLVNTANDFAGDYKKLLALAEQPDVPGNRSLAELSLAETIKYREFKSAGAQGILNNTIASIILPLLADHVLREANHYIRILGDRQDDPVPSPYQYN